MKLKLMLMMLAFVLPGVLLTVGRTEAVAEPTFGQMAVARVNGVEIGQLQLEHYFVDYLQAQGRMVGSIRNPVAYDRLRRAALDDLIDKELLWQEAGKRGIRVDEQSVQDNYSALRTEFTSDEVFNRRLEEAGFNSVTFIDYLRRELTSQRMLAELSQVQPPTQKDVEAFYRQLSPRIHARHILLPVDPYADPAVVEAVRQQLLQLRARIVSGEDFSRLAQQYSQDSRSAEGGDLGYFSRESMVSEFADAAFSLAPGAVSDPVRTVYGWHLIKVDNGAADRVIDDAQGLAMARRALDQQRQAQATAAALQRLRAASLIERAAER
ncbi:peptidylprolyl isomerase [Pseudomonas sp. NPDC088444]|uniref:peptidylprolyl isomerase n=1 Tax=Pseudomonas sp. NPDC088444 TaxID=3364456 RepID=UPI003850346A